MNYPQRPQAPNGWQILGTALQQGGQAVGEFANDQNRLKMLMEEAAQKKQIATMAKIKADRETKIAAEEAAQRLKSEQVRTELAAGKTVPGKSVGGVVGPDEVLPYSPEEANRMLLKSGDLSGKEFSATIDPAKSIEGQKEIFGFKDAAQSTREESKAKYAMAMEEFKQGRMDYRSLMALKAAMNKTEAPKDLTGAEADKLTALGDKRANVKYLVNGFQDSFSGPGTGLQNVAGKYLGTNEDQVLWWQGYSGFINEVRNDLFGAALTPGEKAEFQKTTVTTGMSPSIARKNLARQLQIVEQAVERKKRVANAGRKVNTAQVDAALGDVTTPPPAVAKPKSDPLGLF
jgi:hypothetical protein